MASIVVYDPNDTTVANRIIDYLPSANTPDYEGNPNTLINPDLSGVSDIKVKYWKYSDPDIVEMNQTEKDAIDKQPKRIIVESQEAEQTVDTGDYEQVFSFTEYISTGNFICKWFGEVGASNKLGWKIKQNGATIKIDNKLKPDDSLDYSPLSSAFRFVLDEPTDVTFIFELSSLSGGQTAKVKNLIVQIRKEGM